MEHKAKTCPFCGHAIPEDAEQVCVKTIQEIEITVPCNLALSQSTSIILQFARIATRLQGQVCNRRLQEGHVGPVLQTMVVYLSVVQSVPYNRIAEIMRDILWCRPFRGYCEKHPQQEKHKATPVYDSILSYIEKFKPQAWTRLAHTSIKDCAGSGACNARNYAMSSLTSQED